MKNEPGVDDIWSSWDDIEVMIITNDSLGSWDKCVVECSSSSSCKFHIFSSNLEVSFEILIVQRILADEFD